MAQRKGSLISSMKVAKDQVEAAPAARVHASSEMITTAIHVPKDVLALLRRVAVERANIHGGRPSVSAVLTDLVERNRAALEKEARKR